MDAMPNKLHPSEWSLQPIPDAHSMAPTRITPAFCDLQGPTCVYPLLAITPILTKTLHQSSASGHRLDPFKIPIHTLTFDPSFKHQTLMFDCFSFVPAALLRQGLRSRRTKPCTSCHHRHCPGYLPGHCGSVTDRARTVTSVDGWVPHNVPQTHSNSKIFENTV